MDGTDICRITGMCHVVKCGQYIVYILISGAPCPKVLFYQLNKLQKGVHESEATCPKSHDLQVFLLSGICACIFSMTISIAFLTRVDMPCIRVRSQNSGHRRIPEISVVILCITQWAKNRGWNIVPWFFPGERAIMLEHRYVTIECI